MPKPKEPKKKNNNEKEETDYNTIVDESIEENKELLKKLAKL